jgi:hypothetical protein
MDKFNANGMSDGLELIEATLLNNVMGGAIVNIDGALPQPLPTNSPKVPNLSCKTVINDGDNSCSY